MKSVLKALHLRHHKHTGKILAHQHTSYRVLFLLMLVPILAMTLVDKLDVAASNLMVTATVPAPIPDGAPIITTPMDGATVQTQNITVSGLCPVITPAVIITIYNDNVFAGSAICSADGKFSVPIVISYGDHTLLAKVVTITGGEGKTSQLVYITYWTSVGQSLGRGTIDTLDNPVRILSQDIFLLIRPNGDAVWKVSFAGGRLPYKVQVDWGDGRVTAATVNDNSEQLFTHRYESVRLHDVTMTVHDANDGEAALHIVAATQFIRTGAAGLDTASSQVPPVIAFIQKYVWQIYIGTLSALIFLWYLEHGRHIVVTRTIGKKRLRPRQH